MRAAVSPPGPGSGARMQRSFSHGGPLMHRGHGSSSHPGAVAHRSHDVLDGGDDRVRVVQLRTGSVELDQVSRRWINPGDVPSTPLLVYQPGSQGERE
jgi:hypothetical protein